MRVVFPNKEKDRLVEMRKVGERGPAWAQPLYVAHHHLKGDVGFKWDLNFGETYISSLLF